MAKKRKEKKPKETFVNFKPAKKRSGITRIKVMGVGGGGGNAVSRMLTGRRLRNVEFLAVNTDVQDLNHISAHHKIYIGKALTRGLGAGMDPEVGRQAAEENRSEIMEVLEGTDLLFLTAGFGGGTGTGASPVIAETAKELGILTVAVVTKPFAFEGFERARIAQEGIAAIKDKVDALVVIPNDRIFSLINKETSLLRAFGFVDSVLEQAVQAVSEIINAPGIINVDFADIKAVIKDAGLALIGFGTASGPDRGLKAASAAISSPLLETSIEGARKALFTVAGGRDLKMAEVNDVAKVISSNLDSNAKIIFGAYNDSSLKDKSIKVTVIAAGFNGVLGAGRMSPLPSLFVSSEAPAKAAVSEKPEAAAEEESKPQPEKPEKKKKIELPTSEWDIPTFLRRRKKQ